MASTSQAFARCALCAYPSNRHANIHSEKGSEMITLIVGEEKKQFSIHKNLLCTKAPVFKAMFDGGFKEASKGLAHLPEDSPVAVGLFQEWLYRGFLSQLDIKRPLKRRRDEATHTLYNLCMDRESGWIQVYGFAEKYCIDALMDESLTSIRKYGTKNFTILSWKAMLDGYKVTREGSRLRLYIIRNVSYLLLEQERTSTPAFQKALKDCPDLLDDLISNIRQRH